MKQFPASKHASSSKKFWKPTLSTACLTTPRYSSGRKIGPLCWTMGRINTQQTGPLYRSRQFQDTIQINSPSFVISSKSESVFLPIIMRRDFTTSPEMGSGKGTRYRNSRFLLPTISCREKEQKVTSGNRSFPAKSIHKETPIQDGDSQVSMTIDIGQSLDCLHRPDTTKYSQGISGPSRFSSSKYQSISFSDSGFGMNFPFSFGQTQCSSRLHSPRQTSLTTASNVTLICLETSHSSFQSSGSDQQHDSIPFEMVDGQECPFILQIPMHSFLWMPVIWDGELILRRWDCPFMVAGRKTNPSSIPIFWKW